MRIREFQYPQDYEAAVQLWRSTEKGVRFGPSDAPQEIQKKLARDPDLFLVAEDQDQIVGTVIGGFDGRRGMVYHLAVERSQRGRGIASSLMRELESRLIAKGCIRAFLLVFTSNEEARAFYERINWTPLEDHMTYSKDLI